MAEIEARAQTITALPGDEDMQAQPAGHSHPNYGKLRRDEQVKRELIKELALSDISRKELGRRYGVAHQSVMLFEQQYRADIERVRDRMAGKLADLWIADKRARIAELQDLAESGDEAIRLGVLRQVAEELGELSTRVKVNGRLEEIVTYRIDLGPGPHPALDVGEAS